MTTADRDPIFYFIFWDTVCTVRLYTVWFEIVRLAEPGNSFIQRCTQCAYDRIIITVYYTIM
jgi:hypothetical protein